MASKFQKGVVIATVIDVIIAIGIIVLVGIKIAKEVPDGSKSSPITRTTPLNFPSTNLPLPPSDKPNVSNQTTAFLTGAASTENSLPTTDVFLSSTETFTSSDDEDAESVDVALSTLKSEVFDSSKITGYYNVILTILTSRIFASLLIFIGHKMDIPEFLKSHLDMSIPLTILNFAVYIFIVAEGSPHKGFTALMAVYIVVRKIVLVMEFLHVNHLNAEPSVPKLSMRYSGSTIETVDSTGNQPI